MLTKYGTENIIVMLAAGLIMLLLAFFVIKHWLAYPVLAAGLLLIVFTFWFFRDPDRTIPDEAKQSVRIVLAPADGKIVEIVEEREDVYLNTDAIRISIFLSPLDVHVNRTPVPGVVKYFKYHKGEYMVAYHPKSSIKNEQTHIGVENESGKVFFKQIVGIVARRLAWDIKEGDTLAAGQKFGMMKFGSRMDIAVEKSAQILVKTGQKVVAGETIIARLSD